MLESVQLLRNSFSSSCWLEFQVTKLLSPVNLFLSSFFRQMLNKALFRVSAMFLKMETPVEQSWCAVCAIWMLYQ